ncbi:putative nicotinate phosphoribosyltransferase [compost metagenome]
MGTSLLQKVSRDTYSFTMKGSALEDADGKWRDISRRPASLRERLPNPGRQAVVMDGRDILGIPLHELGGRPNMLQPVFENGRLLKDWSFDDIRERINEAGD